MSSTIKVAELFAGVGGFRLGLDGYKNPNHPEFNLPAAGPFKTIWANQWEPPGTPGKQFAAKCYQTRFGSKELVVEDIAVVLDKFETGEIEIPDVDMVVGGFPCQDYSVAKTLSNARGIEGKKGVLWWEIERFLRLKEPKYVLLENVDRLLKSPASQRGRDFAVMLACLCNLGYSVEWHVVNSAEYGFSQRRKRVYIYAVKTTEGWDLDHRINEGVLAKALPIKEPDAVTKFELSSNILEVSENFGKSLSKSLFGTGGVCQNYQIVTYDLEEDYRGKKKTLRDVLTDEKNVPESFYIPSSQLEKWEYLKGNKREQRIDKKTGFKYFYSEGAMAFPDSLDKPSRTILTGEGGSGPSRFKHVIKTESGRYRRLVPDELDQLQGFPKGWTNTGMSDGNRAFCMGNALVVGIPHLIGKAMLESDDSISKDA